MGTKRAIQYWVIPPEADAEFVAHMEDVLDVYSRPYDARVHAGVANIFMFAEPLAGWRQVSVRDRKTKVDWALVMADLLEGRYAACEKVIVVCDNLNTHTMGAFYETFEPARARSLVSRLEFHYTPKHGSWLNIAENELSSLTRQCVAGRRIGSSPELQQETTAWHKDVNSTQRGVEWQMKVDDARTKLKSVYPKNKT